MIATTSLDAYDKHRDSGKLGEQQRRLMIWLHKVGGEHTRSEIAQATGLRLSSVCGRVNELLELGYLEEGARRACRVTKCGAKVVRIAGPKTPRQLHLIQEPIPA